MRSEFFVLMFRFHFKSADNCLDLMIISFISQSFRIGSHDAFWSLVVLFKGLITINFPFLILLPLPPF